MVADGVFHVRSPCPSGCRLVFGAGPRRRKALESVASRRLRKRRPEWECGAVGVGAPMLCLCTTLGQDGLTARLLVVRRGRAGWTVDASACICTRQRAWCRVALPRGPLRRAVRSGHVASAPALVDGESLVSAGLGLQPIAGEDRGRGFRPPAHWKRRLRPKHGLAMLARWTSGSWDRSRCGRKVGRSF
jgi:hypothetical protein